MVLENKLLLKNYNIANGCGCGVQPKWMECRGCNNIQDLLWGDDAYDGHLRLPGDVPWSNEGVADSVGVHEQASLLAGHHLAVRHEEGRAPLHL